MPLEQKDYENEQVEDNPQTPKKKEEIDGKTTARDREEMRRGKTGFTIKREIESAQRTAKDLLKRASGKNRLSATEVKRYEERLRDSEASVDLSTTTLEEIQRKYAEIDKADSSDTKTEHDRKSPEMVEAYEKYKEVIHDHEDELGTEAAKEFDAWILKQTPNPRVVQEKIVAFLQTELPKRRKLLDKLTKVLGRYNIKPLSIKYIKEQGFSEREAFLGNILKAETIFKNIGGKKDMFYSRKAGQKIMSAFFQTKSTKPQEVQREQEDMLKKLERVTEEESDGFLLLKTAVGKEQMSQKSMDYILKYHKEVPDLDTRSSNMKFWETFVENEGKLTGELEAVFNEKPENKEGFKLAFNIFKDLECSEKTEFIAKAKKDRKEEQNTEKENKRLQIDGIKHECDKAEKEGTLSETTTINYHNWIDEYAKDKTYKQVKEAFDVLTNKNPDKEHKNLAAYKQNREKFQENVKDLERFNPTLSKEDLEDYNLRYDEGTWTEREKIAEELTKEINEAKALKMSEGPSKLLKKVREGREDKESPEIKTKGIAIKTIRDLINLGTDESYDTAAMRCTELLQIYPKDKEIWALLKELANFVDQDEVADELADNKEQDIYDEYRDLAHQQISGNKEIEMEAKKIQVAETGLRLARHDQEKRKTLTAHDRNAAATKEATGHDKVLSDITEDFAAHAEDGEIIDTKTLGVKKAVRLDFGMKHTHEEEMQDRQLMYEEQTEADRRGGQHIGSNVVEFKDRHTGRILDARSGMAAEKAQDKDKEDLAKEVAKKIANIAHIGGTDEDTEHLKLAREAALDEIQEKADTKIERQAA